MPKAPSPPSLIWLPWQRLTAVTWSDKHPRRDAVLMDPAPEWLEERLLHIQRQDDEANEDVLVAAVGATWKANTPLTDPHLWDTFAKENASRRQVTELCRKYGFLRGQFRYPGSQRKDEFGDDQTTRFRETYADWQQELNALFFAKDITFYLGNGQGSQLVDLPQQVWGKIRTEALYKPTMVDRYETLEEADIDWTDPPWRTADLTPEQQLANSLHYMLRKRLRGIKLKLVDIPGAYYPQVRLVPPDLITGLWLQFALSLEGTRTLKLCRTCGQPFVARKSDAQHCSSACKQRAHRARTKQ